jgi:uridine kinase
LMTDFDAYCLYLAIRQHFTRKSYDFFKYHGRVTAKPETLRKRNDRYCFQKLAIRYDDKSLLDLLVSNALVDRTYVHDLLDEDANCCMVAYRARRESLSYRFNEETTKLFRTDPKQLFKTRKNEYPEIMISPETMVILDGFIHFMDKYDSFYGENDLLWPKVGMKIQKYRPFLQYDREKFKEILKDKLPK